MPRVLVTPHVLYELDGPYRQILTAAGLEVVYPPPGRDLMNAEVLVKHLVDIDAVLAGMEPFNADVLAASRLRVIARMGVGYDAIDVPAATAHGVLVTITPGTNEVSVAEQTLALLLGVMRRVPQRDREVRHGKWIRRAGPRLGGKTLGLVGLGRIGRALVPRAQGLGLRVIACDPAADRQYTAAHRVELRSLEALLGESDVVSLHLPASVETTDLINAQTLALMKPGAVLINTARGSLVDEAALYDALASGHLLGAGLDVFKEEPLPGDHPLLKLDNVVVAPHMGGLDDESEVAMSRLAAECVAQLHGGQWPEECIVNPPASGTWQW